jgi:hypothetical protein
MRELHLMLLKGCGSLSCFLPVLSYLKPLVARKQQEQFQF